MRKTLPVSHQISLRGICAATTALVVGSTCVLAQPVVSASGPLRDEQVLVIYDSRTLVSGVAVSLRVAEHYAGSTKVPGGVGGKPGKYPNLRVLDMASTGAAATVPGNISAVDFGTKLRTPLRNYLTSSGLTRQIRCLVLCKGLPHRLQDTDAPNTGDFVGENATDFPAEFNARDATCASVDSELTLLWQDLTTGELGGAADSRSDGCIVNPVWKSQSTINNFTTANILTAKIFVASGTAPVWTLSGSGATRLTAGDIYLVSRLDGHTVAVVEAMIDRSQNFVVNVDTAAVLLDEGTGQNIINPANNGELDNSSSSMSPLYDSDDYEQVAALMGTTDRRFLPANILQNNVPDRPGFYVGTRLTWTAGQGILISNPVALLATYGANHQGNFPTTTGGVSANMIYADSFNYAPGAVFNTIESWNGRDVGGLGLLGFQQLEQAADFLAAGGTFAVCHAWEPLADSVPDNRYLAINFLLGNLTWAEAAWSSIPGLSWSQFVVGDPLARYGRSGEDVNADGVFSIEDLDAWENAPTDINRSGSADATLPTRSCENVVEHAPPPLRPARAR